MDDIRPCAQCEAPIVKKPGPGRWPHYCSKRCAGLATMARLNEANVAKSREVICLQCGATAVLIRKRGTPQKYCSPTCRDRAKRPLKGRKKLKPIPCAGCGQSFDPRQSRTRFCSVACVPKTYIQAAQRIRTEQAVGTPLTCAHCRSQYIRRHGNSKVRRYCSRACGFECRRDCKDTHRAELGRQNDRRQADKNARRRAAVRGVHSERFSDSEIFERDRWICQLCGGKVDPNLVNPHRFSASLDHIVALIKGGPHTRANAQLAHFACNSRKHDRPGGQLRMFG